MNETRIPKMATGTVVPTSVHLAELKRLEDDAKVRSQRRHEWRIAIFTTLGGALLSKPLWTGISLLCSWIASFFKG